MNMDEKKILQAESVEEMRSVKAYEQQRQKAEAVLKDEDQLGELLHNMEQKLKSIPKVGALLSNIPVMVDMLRSYIKKEYTMFPWGTLVGIVAALLYVLLPVDVIPDYIPFAGYVDDAMVVAVTMAFINADVATFKSWKESRDNAIEVEQDL